MNDQSETRLTPRQKKAILALLHKNPEQAAEELKVSRTTLWKWRKLEHFQAELERRQNEIFSESMSRIKATTEQALSVILEIMNNPKAKADARLRAAALVIENAQRLRREESLEQRLADLERQLGIGGYIR